MRWYQGNMAARRQEKNKAAEASKRQNRKEGYQQLNVLVPAELRLEVKIKALREGRDMADVVTELLTEWVNS